MAVRKDIGQKNIGLLTNDMRYLLPLLLLIVSCNNRKAANAPHADQHDYAMLTKENAEERLNALRSSIKDSSQAIMIDAGLAIQLAEFTLHRNGSTPAPLTADSLAVNETGKDLYRCMQRAYELSLAHATRPADIDYYKEQLLIPEKEWLISKFSGKKTVDGLIALHRLQKDMLIVSMVVNNLDSDEGRRQADEQYHQIEAMMKKSDHAE